MSFFKLCYTCVQLENYDVHIDMAVIREPDVWVYLRLQCNRGVGGGLLGLMFAGYVPLELN